MAAKKAENSRSRAGTGARKRAQTPRIKQSAKARRRPLLTALKWVLLGGLVIGALGAAAAAGILWHFGNNFFNFMLCLVNPGYIRKGYPLLVFIEQSCLAFAE